MIQLIFEGPTTADALNQEPVEAGYSQHASGERADWDDGKLSKEGTHPITYAVVGANSNQYEANITLGHGEDGTGFGCDNASPPNRRVPVEPRLIEEPADATSPYAWLAYEGHWGERRQWQFDGPTGPNQKRAWDEPFGWQEDLRPGSIAVPTGSTIGPNAVEFFCDSVWLVSTPVFIVTRLPAMLLVMGVAVGISTGAYLTTRTRYRPAVEEPLRQRRRFGQILRTAARLYRHHFPLFAGISILFVPAGIVVSWVQWLLFLAPHEDIVSHFFSADVAVEAIIALSIGNAAHSVVYWIVLAACTAAVAAIDEGRQHSPLAHYRHILRRFPALIVPRLTAYLIVFGLALTIVGLPWAIRNGIRWTFIEETILLDSTPSREARAASARAVDGHWWHTFACLVALWLFAYLLGPVVGFSLLMWSDASVSFINLASSVVFAGCAPFVAIAQSLLYFDLTSDARTSPVRR
jgi:hypothetical protein